MSSVIQTTTRNPRQIELPPRQLTENLESVLDMAHRAGHGVTFEAETTSAIEWSMEYGPKPSSQDARCPVIEQRRIRRPLVPLSSAQQGGVGLALQD